MVLRMTGSLASGLLAGLVLAHAAAGQDAPKEKKPTSLPVYEVVKTGATASEAEKLASYLGIRSKNVLSEGGAIEFVDATRYLSIPKEKVTESERLNQAIEATRNKDATRKIAPTILKASAISELHVLPESSALSKTASALAEAGLTPEFGKASVGHHELSLYSKDGKRSIIHDNSPIDTEVTYKFTDPNGYPIFGPGAQAQVTYDASGQVSRLFYATRKLKAVGTVQVISQEEANERIVHLFPPKSSITSRLVYFAPPLSNAKRGPRVATLIPWYAYYATMRVTNTQTGAVTEVKSKIAFLPATDDPRFVPTVRISAEGGSQVRASVSVRGGRPPYQYIWGGSNPAISQTAEPTISYTPQVRTVESLLRDPHFNLHRNERLSVTVIDANGISVFGNETVPVEATPLFPKGHGVSMPTYGSENPGDPLHWVPGEVPGIRRWGRREVERHLASTGPEIPRGPAISFARTLPGR